MLTKEQITLFLIHWLKLESGLVVIRANQKSPRPARPYISINFLDTSNRLGASIDQQSMSRTTVSNQTVYQVATEGMRKAIASINVFGENANSLMAKIRDSLDRPDTVENFSAFGIAHLDESQINDLTALQETIYEERAQMDLTIAFVTGSEVDVGTIEHVEIDGTVNGRVESIPVN